MYSITDLFDSFVVEQVDEFKIVGDVSAGIKPSARINNPDASVGVCCSHKVVAVGFNTLCYDASVGVLNPPHE